MGRRCFATLPEEEMAAHDTLSDKDLTKWDRDHFFHPSTHLAQHARGERRPDHQGGEGVFITDRDGNRCSTPSPGSTA
jgi:L-2,4-diaminobutyrate transaminase